MINRRFTLLDAMILIAAAAMAIAWTRATVADIVQRSSSGTMPGIRVSWLIWWPPAAVPTLLTCTMAVLLLRLRRPRPELSQLARQPGAVASGIALAAVTIQWLLILLGAGIAHIQGETIWHRSAFFPTPWVFTLVLQDTGLALISAWLILITGGRWDAEPSWIDRAGRLLGACWIVLFLSWMLLFGMTV